MRILILLLCSVLVCFGQHAERRRAQQKAQQQMGGGGGGGSNPWTLLVVGTTATNSGSGITINTIGCTYIHVVLQGYTTDPTVSDDQGNTPNYRQAVGASGVRLRHADYVNPNTNLNHTFTIGGGDGADYRAAIITGWIGNSGTPIDTSTTDFQGNWGSAGTDGLQAAAIIPAQSSELAVASAAHTTIGTVTINSGYGIVAHTTNTAGYYLKMATNVVSASTQPKYRTTAGSDSGSMILSTYKPQ